MKPWQLVIVASTVSAFAWLAIYAYKQARPEIDHGYTRADQEKLSRLLDEPRPTREQLLLASLYTDDGKPVSRRVKLRTLHAARRTLGKE